MPYKVLSNVKHNGTVYSKDAVVELDDETAEALLALGTVETTDEAVPEVEDDEATEVTADPDPLAQTPVTEPPVVPPAPQDPAAPLTTSSDGQPTPEQIEQTLSSLGQSSPQQPDDSPAR